MLRLLAVFSCLSLVSSFGCSMCASPHDCKFAAYGGLRERADQVHGRVGSILDPANELPGTPKQLANEPTLADLIEPLNQAGSVADGWNEPEPASTSMATAEVTASDNGSEEFEPFGNKDSDNRVVADDAGAPNLVLVLDADPLLESSETEQELSEDDDGSVLRLIDASGNELSNAAAAADSTENL